MIQRTIFGYLDELAFRATSLPLLLTGARQTGKAFAILQLSRKFSQVIHIRLDDPKWQNFFLANDPPEEVLSGLFYLNGKSPAVKRTLLFLEEIQESPLAIRFVKNLHSPGTGLFIAATSSRLTPGLESWPEGREGTPGRLNIFPCTFSEFLGSLEDPELEKGYREVPIPAFMREKLMKKFHLYTLTGGMPEILQRYQEDHHLSGLKTMFDKILENQTTWALRDIKPETRGMMTGFILQNAFPYAATRIKFSDFGNAPYRSREMGETFRRLESLMLLKLIYPSTATSLPAVPDTGRFPRLHIPDTGMVSHFSGIQKELYHPADMNVLFGGQIARQVVGQELRAVGTQAGDLHFWVRPKLQSTAEVDFLVKYHKMVIPVEVKSGEPGRLRSLHQFMDEAPHPFAVRLYTGPVSIQQTSTIRGKKFFLMSLPYFLAGRINEHLDGFIKFVNAV